MLYCSAEANSLYQVEVVEKYLQEKNLTVKRYPIADVNAAAVVSARRAGTTASLDAITKHFSINCMPIVSSNYWAMVHGNTPEEVMQDKEGLQIMRVLGQNMVWLLKCIENGKKSGIDIPNIEEKIYTNFVRS